MRFTHRRHPLALFRRSSRGARLGAITALALLPLAAGCAVQYPLGWQAAEESVPATPLERVGATPGVMYGFAPRSWDLPGGERVVIDVHQAMRESGAGSYRSEFDFTAALGGAVPIRLRCSTTAVGDVHESRFGCRSESSTGTAVTFTLGAGVACPATGSGIVSTLTTPACWQGLVTIDGRAIQLSHGWLDATGSPVGYVSWFSQDAALLMTADIVAEMQIALRPNPRVLSPETKRILTVLTVALSWWEHASSGS